MLDHFKPDDGYPMSVKISDPAARQKRSDEANTKLFVGGLNAKTKEGNVRELFGKVGFDRPCDRDLMRMTQADGPVRSDPVGQVGLGQGEAGVQGLCVCGDGN